VEELHRGEGIGSGGKGGRVVVEADDSGTGDAREAGPVWSPGGEVVLVDVVLLDADYVELLRGGYDVAGGVAVELTHCEGIVYLAECVAGTGDSY